MSDLEIAQRIAAGDRDELELLMRRYNQRLYRTARSILKDDAEAEDAVQEAYLLAYQAMGGISRRREAVDLAGAHRGQRSDWAGAQAQSARRIDPA